ncbi:MAG: NfeD family protein [Ilumatobacteraceae bacterium]
MRRLALGLLATSACLAWFGSSAGAQDGDDDSDNAPAVDVQQISGLVDDIVVNEIGEAIERASRNGSQALVLQVNSRGTVVGRDTMQQLLERVADAEVPVAVWIGPTGARLYGTPAQLLAVADVTGMAPGARVGYTGTPLTVDGQPVDLGDAGDRLRGDSVNLPEARQLDIFKQPIADEEIPDEGIPTITNMVDALDGYEEGGVTLETTEEVALEDGTVRRDTTAPVRFAKLNLVEQLFHTVASPAVTYLLLLIGMALVVFEFFTAGVGVAGVVGAICLFLACTGLAVLPARPWAVGMLVAAAVAFAIDVQVGVPRLWTGVGVALTALGSWLLFEPLPGTTLRPSWITLLAGIGGIMLVYIVGMPSMVRARFATPTIGREWMINELGTVVRRVDPDGVVLVGEGQWRARTNRATPVAEGEQVRVVAIDGVTLEVEPLEGAAQDHRHRRRKS